MSVPNYIYFEEHYPLESYIKPHHPKSQGQLLKEIKLSDLYEEQKVE